MMRMSPTQMREARAVVSAVAAAVREECLWGRACGGGGRWALVGSPGGR